MIHGNSAVFFGELCRSTPWKFLEAAHAGGAAIESYVNPNAKGTNGEELVTDVARFGRHGMQKIFSSLARAPTAMRATVALAAKLV